MLARRTLNPEPRTPNSNREHEPGTRNLERGTRSYYVLPSKKALSLRDREGWRSLRSAFASI